MRTRAAVLDRMGDPCLRQQATAGLSPPGAALPLVRMVVKERTVKGGCTGGCVPARDIPRSSHCTGLARCRWTG
ncbi:MAG TPA: hypothetical protein VGC15_01430 [Acetobacteraceae bacterium]